MYLLGVDVGTSSVKCLLVREDLSIAYEATVKVSLLTPKPQCCEQRPEDWWKATVEAIAILRRAGADLSKVAGVAMCGQMHGLVALDANGRVLRNAILWNDLRTVQECNELLRELGGVEALVDETNNRVFPGFTGPKILWMRNHEPKLYERMRTFVMPKDYVGYRLTGEIYTDVTDASGTGLYNVQKSVWSSEVARRLGLDSGLFPPAYESSQLVGRITRAAEEETKLPAGTFVFAGAGDGVCQSAGMGVVSGDVLGIVIGTSGVVSTAQRSFSRNSGGKLQFFRGCEPGTWTTIGCQLNSGASVQWANHNLLRADENFNTFNRLAESAGAADGVFFLPYIGGERCPYDDANARGVYFGLTSDSSLAQIARSTMEGVTFGLKQIYRLTCSCIPGYSPSHMLVSGGASKSRLWRQVLADIFNLPVRTLKGAGGGGAFGAALIAGVGLGIWGSVHEATARAETDTYVEPGENCAVYEDMFPIFEQLYHALSPCYQMLAEIRKG